MYEYHLEKKIEELDPIPKTWSSDDINTFTETGYLPMAGTVPSGTYLTKKIDLLTLMTHMPGVSVWTGKGALRTTTGEYVLETVQETGDGINLVEGVLNIDEDGWYHVACTWHVTVSTLADEYHEVAMTVLNADMKINMDMSHENSQWRAFAIDRYLVKGSKVKFKFVTNGADGKVKSWLETVSVHRNAAVVGPNFEGARECSAEEMDAWLEEVDTHDPQP